MTNGQKMAITASEYNPTVVIVTPESTSQQLVLGRNPKRLYIEFRSATGSTFPTPYPVQVPAGVTAGVTSTGRLTYKYHDHPGLVTGEWYISTVDALTKLLVITDEYLGD